MLKAQHPLIFCEVHRDYLKALKQSVRELVRFLRNLGYTVKPIQVEDLKSDPDFDNCSHIFASMDPLEPIGQESKRKCK